MEGPTGTIVAFSQQPGTTVRRVMKALQDTSRVWLSDRCGIDTTAIPETGARSAWVSVLCRVSDRLAYYSI